MVLNELVPQKDLAKQIATTIEKEAYSGITTKRNFSTS